jgi:hypothetical protein
MAGYSYNIARRSDRLYDLTTIRARLEYLCEYLFSGSYLKFAERVRADYRVLRATILGIVAPRPLLLTQVIKSGVVNAEWLMCGTGPVFRDDPDITKTPGQLSRQIHSRHDVFDTSTANFHEQVRCRRPHKPEIDVSHPHEQIEHRDIAQHVHAARVAGKPVLLYLNESAISDGAGPLAIEFFAKGYITGVALSIAAATTDVELAFTGKISDGRDARILSFVNDAAQQAAEEGVGYGEALGRWASPSAPRARTRGLIATAFDLELPVTVHGGFGETLPHFYPSRRGAEFGAALGAALYVDMLLFAAQVCECAGEIPGVFIATDGEQAPLFLNALRAAKQARTEDFSTVLSHAIRGPYRHTVPALLAMCDAVYSGNANNV